MQTDLIGVEVNFAEEIEEGGFGRGTIRAIWPQIKTHRNSGTYSVLTVLIHITSFAPGPKTDKKSYVVGTLVEVPVSRIGLGAAKP